MDKKKLTESCLLLQTNFAEFEKDSKIKLTVSKNAKNTVENSIKKHMLIEVTRVTRIASLDLTFCIGSLMRDGMNEFFKTWIHQSVIEKIELYKEILEQLEADVAVI